MFRLGTGEEVAMVTHHFFPCGCLVQFPHNVSGRGGVASEVSLPSQAQRGDRRPWQGWRLMANMCFLDRCGEAGTAEGEACNCEGNLWLKQDAGGSLHKAPLWPWGPLMRSEGEQSQEVRRFLTLDFPEEGPMDARCLCGEPSLPSGLCGLHQYLWFPG